MARKRSANFDAALEGYVKTADDHRHFAGECARFALQHFMEHGDLIYADRFAEAMKETKTMRRSAFIKWMVDLTPAVLQGGKFKFDKTKGKFEDIDVDEVCSVPFWEYAPEEVIVNYGKDDVLKAFAGVIKRFENADKAHLSDDAAAIVVDFKQHLEAVRTNKRAAKKAA